VGVARSELVDEKDHPAIYRGVLDLELGEGWWLHCCYKHVWTCGASMHGKQGYMDACFQLLASQLGAGF
jgi:hypothetical protein